jgi:hypothetical protein
MLRLGTTDGSPLAVGGGTEDVGAFEVGVAEDVRLVVVGLAEAGLTVVGELGDWLAEGPGTVAGEVVDPSGGDPPALPRLLKRTIAVTATTMATAAATTAIRTRGPLFVLAVSLLISSL